jgi:hypothetical protein
VPYLFFSVCFLFSSSDIIQKLGFNAEFTDFKIRIIVGSCDIKFPINLYEQASRVIITSARKCQRLYYVLRVAIHSEERAHANIDGGFPQVQIVSYLRTIIDAPKRPPQHPRSVNHPHVRNMASRVQLLYILPTDN